MPNPRWTWAVLADGQRAKLLHCGPTEGGSPHVDHIDSIETSWQGHQRGRPSPLKGRSNHTFADNGHEDEEDRRRFAQQLVQWLQQQSKQRDITELTVFGPTRFISTLREVCPTDLAQRLQTEPVELINLPKPQLQKHPAIRALIGLTNTART